MARDKRRRTRPAESPRSGPRGSRERVVFNPERNDADDTDVVNGSGGARRRRCVDGDAPDDGLRCCGVFAARLFCGCGGGGAA